MQPNPELNRSMPVLEILDDLVPADLHAAAWSRCAGSGWYYGHGSNIGDGSAFWKMDLDADAAFDAIWERARPRCEELAGTPLRVKRQYANGHTYGLGGRPHKDDGEFTLLYYPNPEWKDGWDGETVFYDPSGEISYAVRPRPNRFVFFDASTLHAGRAPSRACPVLRVTVAYKLQSAKRVPEAAPSPRAAPEKPASTGVETRKISGDGAAHVYSVVIPAGIVEQAVREKLASLSSTLRLPGFRPGNIPAAVMEERYGAQVRGDILNRLTGEALERALPTGNVASAVQFIRGAESGDLEIHLGATCLADLPAIDFTSVDLERLTAGEAALAPEAVAAFLRSYLKAQVLDVLDATYRFTVLPVLVEREFAQVWKAAQAESEIPADIRERAATELRAIAERRLRLGWIVAEMARRNEIRAENGAELEDKVIDHFVAQARVKERAIDEQELRERMQS